MSADAILAYLNRGVNRRYGVAIGMLYAVAARDMKALPRARREVEALIASGAIVATGEADSRLCWSPEGWAEVTARAAAAEEAIAALARHGVKARGLSGGVVIAEAQVGELNRVLRGLKA